MFNIKITTHNPGTPGQYYELRITRGDSSMPIVHTAKKLGYIRKIAAQYEAANSRFMAL